MTAIENRINAAALRLFAERGTAGVTISDLATEADVARGTLYRNVGSMDDLYIQVRSQLAYEIHDANRRLMDAHGDTDPPLRLATGIRLLLRKAHRDPAWGRFVVRFGLTDESLREVLSGPPMKDIRHGLAVGRYNVDPAMEMGVASMIIGATISATWTVLEGHDAWRSAGSSAAELALRALGVPAEEAHNIAVAPLPDLSDVG